MIKLAIIGFTLALLPSTGLASVSPELEIQVEQQMASIRSALGTAQSSSPAEGEDAWLFRNIWIRLTVPMGFTIPELASLSVVPTFEMLVQAPIPDGWQVFQPTP